MVYGIVCSNFLIRLLISCCVIVFCCLFIVNFRLLVFNSWSLKYCKLGKLLVSYEKICIDLLLGFIICIGFSGWFFFSVCLI